jgi:hypothetical protein
LTFFYKIFIVNRKRLLLAIAVLRGTYEPPETTQKNTLNHPRSRARPNSPRSSPRPTKRRPRRQSDRR